MPKVFDNVLYASCWEDPQVDREAFRIGPASTVFTITSGGCNALAFLLDDPKEVIALDQNPHQNYLLELKIAAFRRLEYPQMLEFFGVRDSSNRTANYQELRKNLSENAQAFWDARPKEIERGILHSGRFENYMQMLRKTLTLLIGKKEIEGIFALTGAAARAKYYQSNWMTLRWKFFLRVFLSRQMMSLLFDKAFFAQLGSKFSFGKHFEQRIKFALTELPSPLTNPYLTYMMFGSFREPAAVPISLREENFMTIKSRLDRVTIVNESCEAFFLTLPDNHISHFNFTNIFEWMPENEFEDLLRETVRVAEPGAILTYRNLLVPRSRPDSLRELIEPDTVMADTLAHQDLSFMYSNYRVEHVRKNLPS
jgi:S-adenosylmethionine-diacylglycerol 3-amino-3-carboxypropyl transferase